MADHSRGGHWLDTGDGLQSLTASTGRALDGVANAAYRAYLDHAQSCDECKRRLWNCDAGKLLWDAYRDTRA